MDYEEYINDWLEYPDRDAEIFVKKLRKKLTDEQIAYVLEILDNHCELCYAESPCYCSSHFDI
jgi:hypothetical protein